ncbi:hypothetical protein FJU30_09435 [Affinibrenneria salicis]|uniref:Uncharacterized protein n=1 Tax=Affinibrenneria salicis TaxID=2590031 RepID=A0A5J5G315_9GAMM|nr:hypothetical protein [Affinibrenneria salicis]KAA9000463.1 hypothetical protein FJU30_09435 [Affinibrenneria salicis]
MLIINLEYLIAPLLCKQQCIEDFADNLRIIYEVIVNSDLEIVREERIIDKMIAAQYFPSERIFKSIISKNPDTIYSSQDIVKLLNRVIGLLNDYDNNIDSHEIEWGNQFVTPQLKYLSNDRMEHFKKLFYKASFRLILERKEFFILFSQECNEFKNSRDIQIKTIINDIYPPINHSLPIPIDNSLTLYSDIRKILENIKTQTFYNNADNAKKLKLAFYCGTIEYAKKNRLKNYICWDDFDVGDGFLQSLSRNQCAGNQQFSSVLFNTVIRILYREAADLEVKPFMTAKNSGKQRIFEGLKAYRCHITKHHEALRLMFWVDTESQKITLANVGPKMELIILEP